jgi:hypothetical protein
MALANNEHWGGPTIKKSDLSFPLTIEEKIRIFEDRVLGWQLKIGLSCYRTVPDGGFGALYITLSYFELFARYKKGSVDHKKPGAKFRYGFADFAKSTGFASEPEYLTVRDLLYEGARCGLYHMGMTSKRVFIEGNRPKMFNYDAPLARLVIDPERLILAMITHFQAYVAALRGPGNTALHRKFVAKFDHDILPQIT